MSPLIERTAPLAYNNSTRSVMTWNARDVDASKFVL